MHVQAGISQNEDTFQEYRNNCAAWCGDTAETNCGSRDCTGDAKWSRNTYMRCYGSSTCSFSQCLRRRDLVGIWPGCQGSDDLWYTTNSCTPLAPGFVLI